MSKKTKQQKRASHYKKQVIANGKRVVSSDGQVYYECPRTGTLVRG